ncbi:SDR family NAD(P)-dependent oxidoreductase [Kibdelosporangium phytohabitans]|uniref:3-ketoacyl-ACP reductase n=1 Tax=Kibdelosporangium phytohabitans TaxID=860235 RepID=A0A0N9I8M6_9PSEU|nr:SDR family NAD(P)-dependent oxidoreductase [Kibdelosporangium phytohabitans]ALG14650.1 3-ketoacyl-ACP reductase [Kibdelosporangium phytohabitans]MBE1468347.1 NAD(P)-dependent dehydrogenase (short-subunit alcohol dehydrogenase family) [Kibdelosporangium phytohabitans]
MNSPKVWLITGANSGFGRAISEAATAAGDVVVGTARKPGAETIQLDVTDTAVIPSVVDEVVARHGRIDVLVNNAGRGQVGAAEETTDEELRSLFDVHVFGPAALTRAVLPHMREQGSGAIVQMSSFGGQVSPPGFSAYCATKFALEGFSAALAAEVGPLGIKVLIVEPGAFRTSFSGGGLHESAEIDVYEPTVGPTRRMIKGINGTQPGDPAKAAAAILTALNAEDTPLRLPLGDDAVDGISAHLESVRTELAAWEHLSRSTNFDA